MNKGTRFFSFCSLLLFPNAIMFCFLHPLSLTTLYIHDICSSISSLHHCSRILLPSLVPKRHPLMFLLKHTHTRFK